MRTKHLALAALWVALPGAAGADAIRSSDLVVEQAWARATPASAPTGAAYLTIRNTGQQPDRITAMQAPVAGHVMAHETKQEGDVLKMQEAGPLALRPGGIVEMKPGGTHIMLMGLKGGLKPGQEFPLAVTFERAGTVQVPVKVGKPGAMNPE
ncbi:copper chaperone PCu(A)C [Azospirillum sp. sgz301742]